MRTLFCISAILFGISTYAQIVVNDEIINLQKVETNPTYRWDTIITYDTNNNLFERHTQQIDWWWNKKSSLLIERFDSTWINLYIDTYTYDQNGNLIKNLQQIFEDNAWKNTALTEQAYVNNTKLTTIYKSWNFDSTWKINGKVEFEYDSLGRNICQTNYSWIDTNNWKPTFKNSYLTFTPQNNSKTYLTEMWTNNTWNNYQSGENFYSIKPNGEEVLDSLIEKTYTDPVWVNMTKSYFEYDQNYNIIEHYYQVWEDSTWKTLQSGWAVYDGNNDRIKYTLSIWINDTTNELYRLSTTYDNNHNSIEQVKEKKINGNWIPSQDFLMMVACSEWYYFQGSHRFVASFSPYYVGIDEFPDAYTVYPNPTTDYVFLRKEFKDVRVYSFDGKLQIEKHNTNILNLNTLNPGTYFITFDNHKEVIIKQ